MPSFMVGVCLPRLQPLPLFFIALNSNFSFWGGIAKTLNEKSSEVADKVFFTHNGHASVLQPTPYTRLFAEGNELVL